MTPKEFNEVVGAIRRKLFSFGLADLADPQSYAPDVGTKEPRLNSKEIAIKILLAFDRHLSILDRRTYQGVMEQIRTLGGQPGLNSAYIDFSQSADISELFSERVSLSSLHDLTELRTLLQTLINRLRETDISSPS